MLITKKMLVGLALAVALVGAGVGALVTHTAGNTASTSTSADPNPVVNQTAKTPDQLAAENSTQFKTTEEQTAYRQGFDDGYQGCVSAENNSTSSSRTVASYSQPARRYSNGRPVYYGYTSARHGRSFWQKHRDKLTMGIGTGLGGALLGDAPRRE